MITENEKSALRGNEKEARTGKIFWWVRILVTTALAVYLLSKIRGELNQVSLQIVQPRYIAIAIIMVIFAIVGSVWLWRLILLSSKKPSFIVLSAHYLLGLFYNNFLPGGIGGDIVRTGALVQGGEKLIVAANSVLMTRLIGLWGIVMLAGSTIPIYRYEIGIPLPLPLILSSIGALTVTLLISTFLFGAPLSLIVDHLPQDWQRWHNELRMYRSHPKLLITGMLISIGIQILAVGVNFFITRALGLSITFMMLFVSIPIINLISLIPISIGGFGVRETIYFYLLSRFGISTVEAVVLSLSVYLLIAIISAIGAVIMQLWIPRNGRGI